MVLSDAACILRKKSYDYVKSGCSSSLLQISESIDFKRCSMHPKRLFYNVKYQCVAACCRPQRHYLKRCKHACQEAILQLCEINVEWCTCYRPQNILASYVNVKLFLFLYNFLRCCFSCFSSEHGLLRHSLLHLFIIKQNKRLNIRQCS